LGQEEIGSFAHGLLDPFTSVGPQTHQYYYPGKVNTIGSTFIDNFYRDDFDGRDFTSERRFCHSLERRSEEELGYGRLS
jgi:hypothetical protein